MRLLKYMKFHIGIGSVCHIIEWIAHGFQGVKDFRIEPDNQYDCGICRRLKALEENKVQMCWVGYYMASQALEYITSEYKINVSPWYMESTQ